MSSNSNEEVSREVAWRVFAREYNDADLGFKEGEDERAPNYVATPTGAKINRLFVTGVLTEVERVGEDDLLRARVSDPTGTFVVYAGQYQPDAVSFFADAETPGFVAVVGKARTYEPEDSDEVYTSVRPEEVNVVDAETRDRWNVETAHETLKRVEAVREYLRTGETPEMRPEVHELGEVLDHYGTDEAYLNELEREARDVLTEVAGVEAGSVGAGREETGGATEAGTETRVEADTDTETGAEAGTGVESETESVSPEDSTTTASEAETQEGTEAGTEEKEVTAEEEFEDIEQEEVGDWEWDEGQREEVEEEFGAEFESGSELTEEDSETGEESEEESVEEADEPSAPEPEPEEADETEETTAEAPTESAETVVMDIIEEESGDDGVERSEILSNATDRGIDEEVAEATLEDLLLEGMCYPTDGDRIKPI